MSAGGRSEWADEPQDDGVETMPGGGVERTVAVWHPGMSRATYLRLLRMLFDPPPDDDDTTRRAA